MTEIEKLYELAGIKPDYDYFTLFDDKVHKIGRIMHLCKEELKHWLENYQKDYVAIKVIRVDKDYPPFTAEKQIEIIKFLLKKSVYYDTDGDREYWFHLSDEIENSSYKEFDEALAECINKMWEDLRDYEKVQLQEILK